MSCLSSIQNKPNLKNVCESIYAEASNSHTTNVKKSKSNLHYTRRTKPKRVTSGGAHLRGSAPELHSSEKTSQRWRAVERFLTGPGIEPQSSRTDSVR